jgi:hypothetical protein
MSKLDELAAAARRKAEELFIRTREKEAERLALREQERQKENAKIAQLRELRLAKETAERATKRRIWAAMSKKKPTG